MLRVPDGNTQPDPTVPDPATRLLWSVAGHAFRAALRLPPALLLAVAGASPRGLPRSDDLDPRARFHAWLVTRFGGKGSLDPIAARKPRLLSLRLLEGRPVPMAECRDVEIPGGDHAVRGRLYVPRTSDKPAPLLVYFHFGGGVLGDLETCHTACSMIAHHGGCAVLSVDYRLAPEHRFPAALEDAIAAFRWAVAQSGRLDIDRTRIGVGGDSVGGHLAAAVSLYLREAGEPLPWLQLLIYPVIEMDRSRIAPSPHDNLYPLTREDMDWFTALYLSSPDDAALPLCSISRAASLAGLPQTLFIQAGHDVLREEGRAFAARLIAEGVPTILRDYPKLPHAFTAMSGGLPAARAALVEIGELVGQAFQNPAPIPQPHGDEQ